MQSHCCFWFQVQNGTVTNGSAITVTNDTDDIVGSGRLVCRQRYTGTRCLTVLEELAACESSENSDVFISNNFIGDQNVVEEETEKLFAVLEAFIRPSDECRNAVVPFFCLYNFGLCGENSADSRPSLSECSNIRDSLCKSEWEQANQLLERNSLPPLPDCSTFNNEGLQCTVTSGI